jgi:hypothetical protein
MPESYNMKHETKTKVVGAQTWQQASSVVVKLLQQMGRRYLRHANCAGHKQPRLQRHFLQASHLYVHAAGAYCQVIRKRSFLLLLLLPVLDPQHPFAGCHCQRVPLPADE